jgi:hypothetical protein
MSQKLTLLIFGLLGWYTTYSQATSPLIYWDQQQLTYVPFAMKGQSNAANTIPDFSYTGYGGGGISLPSGISIEVTVSPLPGDDTRRIQAAIDLVEGLEADENGFRGVVLIKAGHYSLENLLVIRKSGVVLRGEGQGLNGTVLHANLRLKHSVISILGAGSIRTDTQTEQVITTGYVPVGSYSFEVADASDFGVGDRIVVTRTPNHTWIDELGMDQKTLCAGKSGCNGWTTSGYRIDHERVVAAVSGNTISIDLPIVDVMEDQYGGGVISKIEASSRISHCGIENMRIQSFYDGDLDEDHAWTAIRLRDAENCWVKGVTGQYLAYSTVNIENANFTTVQDCAYIDPKSSVSGGRRYSFAIQKGVGNLFQRCYTKSGRHDFVTGSRVTGPNVFLDGLAEDARSNIGPHHRWATGTLFDNIRGGSTRVRNRGNSGSGHGWSGAQTMFWNVESYSGEVWVDSPHGAMNWAIGCTGTNQVGEGYWESWGTNVQPRSLYLQQLEDRLGSTAIDNVVIPGQKSGKIYELLAAWAGQGPLSGGGFQGAVPSVSFVSPTGTIDVSTWEGGDIQVDASDSDGVIQYVKLLINGEPMATDDEAPYIFTGLTDTIQELPHLAHYLQAIAIDNDGNTTTGRLGIVGGVPPEEDSPPEDTLHNTDIRVFPNPTQNRSLTIQMMQMGRYTVKIFDLYGGMVDQFMFEGLAYQAILQDLPDGIYLLKIQDVEKIIYTTKLLVK